MGDTQLSEWECTFAESRSSPRGSHVKSMVVDESKHQNNGRYAFMSKKYSADMGVITRKHAIMVCDKIKLNPASLASELSM